jgi:CBS domain-containing protein
MKIRDVMTTDIRSAELNTTIEMLAKIMRDEDVGAVPVLDNGELCGIVTDRDIVVRCIAHGRGTADTTVVDILSSDLQGVSPSHETAEAARIMADLQVRRLPVVENGKLVGMVSIGDLAVKSDTDNEHIGRTLEQVSEGVKASGEAAQRAGRSGPRDDSSSQISGGKRARGPVPLRQNSNARSTANGGQKRKAPKRQQPGSATQMTERSASQVRGRKPAAVTGGGRQKTIETASGRGSHSTRGRVAAKQSTARGGRSSRGQSAASRGSGNAKKGQSRVVTIGSKTSRSQRRKAS